METIYEPSANLGIKKIITLKKEQIEAMKAESDSLNSQIEAIKSFYDEEKQRSIERMNVDLKPILKRLSEIEPDINAYAGIIN